MLDEVEELAALGTWEWNLATDVIRWSPEQLRIHGMSPDAGTQTFAEFLSRVHPEDQGRMVAECERLIATGESFTIPSRVVRPDGTVREMQAMGKLLPDATGQQVRMVGTAQDVTERNRADRALPSTITVRSCASPHSEPTRCACFRRSYSHCCSPAPR